MIDDTKRAKISALVDEAIADPSRAQAVKEALSHIADSADAEPAEARATSRPSRFDVEDFFDNMPV